MGAKCTRWSRHWALVAALLISTTAPSGPSLADSGRRAPLTRAQTELVEWASGRFERAGLDVPNVSVVFDPGAEECGGFLGRYFAKHRTLYICIRSEVSELTLRRLVLHEMSHAWTDDHLSDSERERFVALRGTPTWSSWDHQWTDRAIEHAAVVMAWGLMDVIVNVEPIGDTSASALGMAFRSLTGADPINDGWTRSADATERSRSAIQLS